MSKFNVPNYKPNVVQNYEGAPAYRESPKLELVSILATSFVEDKFYRSAGEEAARVITLIENIEDKKFVAKAAIYARNVWGMRSISHLVAAVIAHKVKNKSWTKNFMEGVVFRVDDMAEILSCYLRLYTKPIPNLLKKGFALAFNKFNEYQLAKYRNETSAIKLVDVVNLVHPVPNDINKEALRKLINGELKSLEIWETKLTQAGQVAETEEEKAILKENAWAQLLNEEKLGYFALLRNLRNIIEQCPDMVATACHQLIDRDAIKKSLILPFRFATAYREIGQLKSGKIRLVQEALNLAINTSLDNVPRYEGKTAILVDVSGSMSDDYGEKSTIDIASLFAAALYKTNDADMVAFSGDAHWVRANPSDSIFTIANGLKSMVGGSTNLNLAIRLLNRRYDRIIILSDEQNWDENKTAAGDVNVYKKTYSATPIVYSFDIAGYGTLQIPEKDVYCLAGWSDKVFDIMKFLESDKEALINEIEKVEL